MELIAITVAVLGCVHGPISQASPSLSVTVKRLAAYLSFFDCSGSGIKYVQSLKKASSLAEVTWPLERDVKELLRDSGKFAVGSVKSYLPGKTTGVIINDLCLQGYTDLARLVAVCYTFQLRAQSEAFRLQYGVRSTSGSNGC